MLAQLVSPISMPFFEIDRATSSHLHPISALSLPQLWLSVGSLVCQVVDGFGGLVVSMLSSCTRVRGFKPGRSRCIFFIFRTSEKSSVCLPSEGKWKNLFRVPALRHVKEPSTSVNYECASKIPCIVPSFASRGFSCLWCVAPLEMNEGNSLGARVQSAYRLQCRKSPTRDL